METVPLHFFEALGNLFYAVAASDRHVRPSEAEKVLEAVERCWSPPSEEDEAAGHSAAEEVMTIFNRLCLQRSNAETTWRAFRKYYSEHTGLFSDSTRSMILE